MANARRVGLVTVSFNSGSVIDEFLDSFKLQDHPDLRLYVIDNNSGDDTRDRVTAALSNDPRVKTIWNTRNAGVAVGNNQGIRAALEDGCEDVLLINNDTVFDSSLVGELQRQLDMLGAELIVPKITYAEPPYDIWCAGGRFNRLKGYATRHVGEGEPDRGQYNQARRIEYSPTCCMLIRGAVFKQIGLMDENYFVYFDDTDFCMRALRAGLGLWYTPAATLRHKVSSLTGGTFSKFSMTQLTRGKVYFIRKHFHPLLTVMWLAAFQAILAARTFSPRYGPSAELTLQRAFWTGLAITIPKAAGK